MNNCSNESLPPLEIKCGPSINVKGYVVGMNRQASACLRKFMLTNNQEGIARMLKRGTAIYVTNR